MSTATPNPVRTGAVRLEPSARSHFLVHLADGSARERLAMLRVPTAQRLDDSEVWAVPALPRLVGPVRRLLRDQPGLELDLDARALLNELADLPLESAGRVTLTGEDGDAQAWFVVTIAYGPTIVEAIKRVPGRTYDKHHRRWFLPAAPGSARALKTFLEQWSSVVVDPAAAPRLEALAEGRRAGPARLRLDEDGEEPLFRIDAHVARELAGEELDEGTFGIWTDPETGELAIEALPEASPALRAILEGAEELEVGDDVEARLLVLEETQRRLDELVALSHAQDSATDVPTLAGTLRPFQRAGVEYALRTRRCFLADEQGLGKTIQALATVESEQGYPALVVCPASLKLTWRREIERWLPERSIQVIGRRSEGGEVGRADITIVNYEQLAGRLDALAELGTRSLIFDESHFCKNPRARRTKAARKLARGMDEDALVLLLTGTPLLNRPMELVPQLDLLGRLDAFGGFGRFLTAHAKGHGLRLLNRRLRATCLVRRRKTEVLTQLPDKQRSVVPIELANRAEYTRAEADVVAFLRQRAAEEQVFLSTLEGLDDAERRRRIRARGDQAEERALRAEPLVRLTALKQIAARGKLPGAIEWVRSFLESGEKLVLFAHHREALAGLRAAFPGAAHVVAEDREGVRQENVERFQTDEDCRLIICAQQLGGFGLTLTAASNVAFLELGWNPAVHDQAEDRVHRIGQDRQVTAWYLLAAGTVDEPIGELIERKRAVVSAASDGATVGERGSVLGELVDVLVAGGTDEGDALAA